ncbi:PREDICTED: uncharacterized protein LOC108524598 [Rhinopithecus bieti]|uniref:uncharacterized protein LOC108524598 n=1 Tax=Rhinopithecus bieti TaxID=61621 RepID=UPI00083BD39D|nr:PREDICTED: uncharacterized protein LOC108524598 [Rhinopithecus bieti]
MVKGKVHTNPPGSSRTADLSSVGVEHSPRLFLAGSHVMLMLHICGPHFESQRLSFLFPTEGASEEEIRLSKMVMKFWANFARNGNPNGEGLPLWPEYNQEEGYLQIGANTQAAQKLKDKEVAFWTKLLPRRQWRSHPRQNTLSYEWRIQPTLRAWKSKDWGLLQKELQVQKASYCGCRIVWWWRAGNRGHEGASFIFVTSVGNKGSFEGPISACVLYWRLINCPQRQNNAEIGNVRGRWLCWG